VVEVLGGGHALAGFSGCDAVALPALTRLSRDASWDRLFEPALSESSMGTLAVGSRNPIEFPDISSENMLSWSWRYPSPLDRSSVPLVAVAGALVLARAGAEVESAPVLDTEPAPLYLRTRFDFSGVGSRSSGGPSTMDSPKGDLSRAFVAGAAVARGASWDTGKADGMFAAGR
jgi:hypothetical protein